MLSFRSKDSRCLRTKAAKVHEDLDAVIPLVEAHHPAADEECAGRQILNYLALHLLQHVLWRLLAQLG